MEWYSDILPGKILRSQPAIQEISRCQIRTAWTGIPSPYDPVDDDIRQTLWCNGIQPGNFVAVAHEEKKRTGRRADSPRDG